MLTLLSPAKTLDETPAPTAQATQPRLLERSQTLIDILRTLSEAELATLMHISDELAVLNVQRYRDWEPPFSVDNARQAVFLFAGDVYRGLDARHRFTEDDVAEATTTLRILSGLYGLLRPTDLIQPYRLEMGIRLKNPRGKDLYQFWADEITDLIADDLDASPGDETIINLASQEYFGAVNTERLGVPVVNPRFEDQNAQGQYKIITFYAKQARGDMAGWIVTNRVHSPQALRDYDGMGYRYVADASTPDQPVFRRPRGVGGREG